MVHPGCGKSSKGKTCRFIQTDIFFDPKVFFFFRLGKGFNSVGSFCDGWAGNCGDGGKGASSWYLMCENCREK